MNKVQLGGTAKRIRGGDGASTAWAFVLVEVDGKNGKKASHSVKAFGEVANKLRAFEEGDEVEIVGHLERQKPKDGGENWETIVVADRATGPQPQEEDIPF